MMMGTSGKVNADTDMRKPIKTKEDALIIRKFRKAGKWRHVARKAAEKWPDRGYLNSSTIEGLRLCWEAAKILNEDPRLKPWD